MLDSINYVTTCTVRSGKCYLEYLYINKTCVTGTKGYGIIAVYKCG